MAAGVELDADAVDPFRRALAAHAAAALSPDDLIPVERVDAIVPGGDLGLDLAEDLELLRPFGMGNPQPTLLVPAARFERVTGMGEEKEHSRFTLVTAGGKKSRGVAFRSRPSELAPATKVTHDIALRLEKNRWNGVVEPRVLLRALCPTEPGELRVLGEGEDFWDELRAPVATAPLRDVAGPAGAVEDRRCEGFAGVAGDLFSSGESVLVAVADVPRRRAGLEGVVAALSDGPMPVASWAALAAEAVLGGGLRPPRRPRPAAARHRRPAPGRNRESPPRVGPRRGPVRDVRLPRRARPPASTHRGLPRPAAAPAGRLRRRDRDGRSAAPSATRAARVPAHASSRS